MSSPCCSVRSKGPVILVVLIAVCLAAAGMYVIIEKAKMRIIEEQFKFRALDYKKVTQSVYSQILSTENLVKKLFASVSSDGGPAAGSFTGEYARQSMERFKDLLASIRVSKTGYIYVLNSRGQYVVSRDRKRDGETIWDVKDAEGNLFIQDMIRKARALGENEATVVYYFWKNKDEKKARQKIAGIAYVPELDWVIGLSSYVEELQ
jgi:signal transduction histidine kinase